MKEVSLMGIQSGEQYQKEHGVTRKESFVMVSESRLRDAKEIFEKDVREKGLRVYVQKESKNG